MKRSIVIAALVAGTIALPASAMANTPDGTFTFKANESLSDSSNASVIGELSSQITQNGQHVSGNGSSPYDQTTPRDRGRPVSMPRSVTSHPLTTLRAR